MTRGDRMPTPTRRKLIEVSLPLDAINAAAAREKSIRHGHPSTLHLWWARRPLAAARAVIFAQTVDDPSEYVDVASPRDFGFTGAGPQVMTPGVDDTRGRRGSRRCR